MCEVVAIEEMVERWSETSAVVPKHDVIKMRKLCVIVEDYLQSQMDAPIKKAGCRPVLQVYAQYLTPRLLKFRKKKHSNKQISSSIALVAVDASGPSINYSLCGETTWAKLCAAAGWKLLCLWARKRLGPCIR